MKKKLNEGCLAEYNILSKQFNRKESDAMTIIDKKKIQALAIEYHKTKDSKIANELVMELYPSIERRAEKAYFECYKRIDKSIFQSDLSWKLLMVTIPRWNPDKKVSFLTYWFRSQENQIKDTIRNESRRNRRFLLDIAGNNSEEDSLEIERFIHFEDFDQDKEQRQLLDILKAKSGKLRNKIEPIFDAFLLYGARTYEDAGNIVGCSPATIGNRLKKLAKLFSEDELGFLSDYFEVA